MATVESDKIMYEIYQEEGYGRRFRVVYFTELTERNRDLEIGRALAGRHVHDGFISGTSRDEAKIAIDKLLEKLNAGQELAPEDCRAALDRFR